MSSNGTCDYVNAFGLTQYDGQCSFFGGAPALPEGLGWFVVVGLGAVFTAMTSLMVWLNNRYNGVAETSEHFSTAGHSIKVGLTAADIVSKWTWAATLLQSSNVAYKFGVSGPFWYASGATVQVILFSILAVEIKRKAPTVHTVLEIIKIRWGKAGHLVYLFFCIATNIIVTAMLILGGAAVINALTGVNVYAAAFLIPVGVAFYTAHGGLHATFLAAWAHTAVIYVALCIFTFIVYGTSDELGSPAVVWDRLTAMAELVPVKDNKEGSYLTMYSKSGLIFGVINIIGNFGTVFVDQSYWQSAIAAKPTATYKGYLLGGLCWFAIPFTMATTLGLAGRALDLPITIEESDQGLTPPAVAVHLMGQGGAFLLVLQLFLAVTSTGSAEQIAVSSLISYDIYRDYINPKATGRQIMLLSRVGVCVYSVVSGAAAVILLKLNISLGWVYLFMGIIIGSAVFPMASCITWNKVSAKAAIISSLVGMPLAIMTWLITAAKLNDGVISIKTTGQDYPMLAGNLVALFFSAIVCIVLSYIWPADFDWTELRNIPTLEEDASSHIEQEDMDKLDQVYNWTIKTGTLLTFVLLVAWPLLALPAGVFSKGYWTFWVVLAIIWGLVATAFCILLPMWESRQEIISTLSKAIRCQPAEPPTPAGGSTHTDPSVSDIKIKMEMVRGPEVKA